MSAASVNADLDTLRYPTGRFSYPERVTGEEVKGWIEAIEKLPAELAASVANLTDAQLDTPYREDGWTIRQVVHHVADSHLNSYGRYRLALTEESPTIRQYDEKGWAELADAREAAVPVSLNLLANLHERWVYLLRRLTDEQWGRTIVHPKAGVINLKTFLALYAWHGRHHVAHITQLRARRGW